MVCAEASATSPDAKRHATLHYQYILITDAAKKSSRAATKAMAKASAMLSTLLSFMLRSFHCMGAVAGDDAFGR